MDVNPTGQVGIRLAGVRIPFVRLPEIDAPPVVVSCGPPRGRAVGVYEYGDPDGRPVFALHGTPACGAGFDWTDAPAANATCA